MYIRVNNKVGLVIADPESCSALGCKNKMKAKGYCEKHYKKLPETRKLDRISYKKREKAKRIKALDIYHNKCGRCGNDDLVVLQWHHRNGNKHHELKKLVIARVIKACGQLPDILLLCANCHIHMDLEDQTNNHGADYVS